ncbi:MAG: hypothetical protein LUQ39_01185 [Methanomassiliicoccales archaeon]|jgi:hypothetical protein|nr:hypothetical protein [Methanomassiliicoccales archaeon]
MSVEDFLTVLLLTFALFMVLAGAFTAYFGSGKSRTIGIVLLVVGLIVGIVWVYLTGFTDIIDVWLGDVVWAAFLNIIAAVIGALIAIGVFLLAIMKS